LILESKKGVTLNCRT